MCREEDRLEAGITVTDFTINEGETVLGRKLENPYSIENMTKAIEQVRPSMLKSGEVLQPNFIYVRFLPKNYEEFELLYNDTTLSLFDVPLDYEIISEGEDFHDPSLPADQITWQYTVVPVGYSFPEVEYEILDEIYIPKAEERDIETQALIITNNYKPDTTATLKADIVPYGKIMVFDDVLYKDVPAIRVKVRANNWFRVDNVYTKSDGSFQMHEKFAGKVDIRLVFENEHARLRSTLVAVSSADIKVADEVNKMYLTISRRARNLTLYPLPTDPAGFKSFNHEHTWALATVSNLIEEYRTYCTKLGVGLPPDDLRVWVNRNESSSGDKPANKSMSGAAPMFYGNTNNYHINIDEVYDFFLNTLYMPAINPLNGTITAIAPDIVFSYGSEVVSCANLPKLVFHELGHASHYKKVGKYFWAKYVNYIISNAGYGDGDEADAKLCALGEMWGYFIGSDFSDYKNSTSYNINIGVSDLEYFTPYKPPCKADEYSGWIPNGLLVDLKDTIQDKIRTGYTDHVTGYTNQMFFNALDSDIESPSTFKNRLLSENGNLDYNDVVSLFTAYYY